MGETVLEIEDEIDSIYFVEEGIVNVVTEFENNEFLLDKLGPGSAINYRAFFLKDQMYVNMEAATEVKILILPYQRLIEMVNKHASIANSKTSNDKN